MICITNLHQKFASHSVLFPPGRVGREPTNQLHAALGRCASAPRAACYCVFPTRWSLCVCCVFRAVLSARAAVPPATGFGCVWLWGWIAGVLLRQGQVHGPLNRCWITQGGRLMQSRFGRIWMENFFFDFNFFLSKISRSDRGSNLRSFDFDSFSTRLLKPLSYRANQNNSKTNRFYTKQICVGFSFCSSCDIMHSKNWI